MLNINNLNRARRVLSAQEGAKAPSIYESLYEQERIEQDLFQDFVNKNFKKILPKAYKSYPMHDKTNINMKIIGDDARQQLKEAYENQQGLGSFVSKVDTNLNLLSKEEETFAKEKLKPWYNTTYGLSKEQRQDIKDRYAWSKENPDKDVADFDHYATPKEMEQKAKETQPVPDKKLAQVSSLTPPGEYTTQPTTPVPQNTTITTPQITKPQIQRSPTGFDTYVQDSRNSNNDSFAKGQAIGQEIGAEIGNVLNSEGMKVAGNIGSKVSKVTGALENTLIDKTEFADDDPLTNGKGAKVFDTIQAVGAKFGPVGNAIAGVAGVVELANGLIKIGKSQKFAKTVKIGGYDGTMYDINRAVDKAGKSYGLFGFNAKSKANKFIDRARIRQYALQGIEDDARDLNSIRSYMDPYYLQYESDMSGGYDQRYMHVAKLGGTLTLIRGTALQNSLLESFKKEELLNLRLRLLEQKYMILGNLSQTLMRFLY